VACMIYTGGCTIVNDYDGHMQFECAGGNQFIAHVSSVHDNHREDRVFSMGCRNFPINVAGLTPSCYWTGILCFLGLLVFIFKLKVIRCEFL
jgi:hypothetical protein